MAQGLDRRVTFHVTTEGTRDETGNDTPGPVVDVPAWATLLTAVLERNPSDHGIELDGAATWRVRWRRDLATHNLTLGLTMTDDGGTTWRVTTRAESGGGAFQRLDTAGPIRRRRWLDFQVTEVSA